MQDNIQEAIDQIPTSSIEIQTGTKTTSGYGNFSFGWGTNSNKIPVALKVLIQGNGTLSNFYFSNTNGWGARVLDNTSTNIIGLPNKEVTYTLYYIEVQEQNNNN